MYELNCSPVNVRAESTSSETNTGAAAMMRGDGRPASAAALAPIAATYIGTGVPPATVTGHTGLALNSVPRKSTPQVSKIERRIVRWFRNRWIVLGQAVPNVWRSTSRAPNPSPRLKLPCERPKPSVPTRR